jgi:hypothetical protein
MWSARRPLFPPILDPPLSEVDIFNQNKIFSDEKYQFRFIQ